jgi:hypothetical protein
MPDDIEHPPRGYNTEDVKTIETEAPPPRRRFARWKLIVIALLLVPMLGVALWTFLSLSWSYSEGDRVGYVQKFSRKGWLCKTWEGELAMTPVPGAIPHIFEFTVRDDAVARRINDAPGKLVSLHYEEKRGVPSTCFGDTRYYITAVRIVE